MTTFDTSKLTLAEKKALLYDLKAERRELDAEIHRLAQEISWERQFETMEPRKCS